jgi:hypothetical protein
MTAEVYRAPRKGSVARIYLWKVDHNHGLKEPLEYTSMTYTTGTQNVSRSANSLV